MFDGSSGTTCDKRVNLKAKLEEPPTLSLTAYKNLKKQKSVFIYDKGL